MTNFSSTFSTPEQIEAVFETLSFSPPETVDPQAAIGYARDFIETYGRPDVAKRTERTRSIAAPAAGATAEYVVPDNADESRRIVYLHGGGWMAGSPNGYRALAAVLAKKTGYPVLLVDYRLAPEHPYPAGLDDCVAAYQWAAENGPSGAAPASRLYLVGDSAGGNLAVATAMRIGRERLRQADGLVSISGMLDAVPSDYAAHNDTMCTPDSVAGSTALYLQGQQLEHDPLISCVQADEALLRLLPPSLLQVSSDEYFLDCNRRFFGILSEARVRAVLSVWPLLPHVWHQALDIVPEAEGALSEIAAFLESIG